ncbi:MAG: response regulator [Gemmatimonadales bacterium]
MAAPLRPESTDRDDQLVPVLLVDDEPVNLAGVQDMLEGRCRCVQAHSADEALLHLLSQDFAAIILDIRLPGMTGIDLARLIKRRRRTEHVPILFLTAHMLEESDVLRGYNTGAVDYLTKPVNPHILRSKIAVFADLYRKSRALERANEALQKQMAQREVIEDALRKVNQELEQRVEERTAALRAADQRKDEFLAALAHELRNPLAALQGAAEVIRLTAPPKPELKSSQGVITRQLRQMARLVDDLLDVSRITRGRLVLRKTRVELSAVIDDALEISRPALEAHGHSVTVDLPAGQAFLDADPVRLSQIVANLLDNAAKYTDPKGRVHLGAQVVGSSVQITVEDNGVGIDPAVLPTVFDLFVQAEHPGEQVRSGLGIGLTLVRRLVELHDGTVEATSEGPGRGSRFTVRLPLPDAHPSTTHAAAAEPAPRNDGPLRVLIVEDNRDAADMLSMLVSSWGHTVRVAADGLAALEVAEAFRPEAVLLDIGLPKLDGHGVARRLRAQLWSRHTLIVAITGRGQEADRQRSEEVGIDRHLLKPVDLVALRGLLSDASLRLARERVVPA